MPKFKIELVNKYETHLFPGDYSDGTFVDGQIEVNTQEEADIIKKYFLENREIELYECTNKYRSERTFSSQKTVIKFPEKDFREDDTFDKGFSTGGNGAYRYFYWLRITNPSNN